MNYLGLIGLLGLTGERGGAPVQAAGQIADLGGGALMAAFGIMAALRERDGQRRIPVPGSGEGQMVDVSMADGALSWLAMVAATYFADGSVPRRGDLPLAGALVCYRPYECADGWVSLGALEPKFWQAWCRGVGREELIEKQFERPGSDAHEQVAEIFKGRTRDAVGGVRARTRLLPGAGAGARRGARLRARARRGGWWSSSTSPARRSRCASSASRSSSTARRASTTGCPGPALGEHTEQVLAEAGYSEQRDRRAARGRSGGRSGRGPARHDAEGVSAVAASANAAAASRRGGSASDGAGEAPARELLKMSELAERSGVSPGTIRYYLREGLLGDGADIVRTSRNMAYYPPDYVERIALIKRLQEERFMPLRVIRGALREDPDRVRALIELEDRIIERALASAEGRGRVSRQAAAERYGVPRGGARPSRRHRRAHAERARL